MQLLLVVEEGVRQTIEVSILLAAAAGVAYGQAYVPLQKYEAEWITEQTRILLNAATPLEEKRETLSGLRANFCQAPVAHWSYFVALPALDRLITDPDLGKQASAFQGELHIGLSSYRTNSEKRRLLAKTDCQSHSARIRPPKTR
jgi:hypothetical protein